MPYVGAVGEVTVMCVLLFVLYVSMMMLLFAFQSMFISVWVSRLEIAEFPDSVPLSAP